MIKIFHCLRLGNSVWLSGDKPMTMAGNLSGTRTGPNSRWLTSRSSKKEPQMNSTCSPYLWEPILWKRPFIPLLGAREFIGEFQGLPGEHWRARPGERDLLLTQNPRALQGQFQVDSFPGKLTQHTRQPACFALIHHFCNICHLMAHIN